MKAEDDRHAIALPRLLRNHTAISRRGAGVFGGATTRDTPPVGPRPSQIRCHIAAGRHRRLMAVDDVRERPVSMDLYDSNGLRIQLVNATRSLNISAGVWKPSVLLGLWFSCLAIALSWGCE